MIRPCLAGALLAAAVLSGCSSGSSSKACGPVVHETLDSRSTQHLLPGTPDPVFVTNPPTSGPHRPGVHPTGVLTQPIEGGVQVSMLEGGAVLVQYRSLDDAARAKLNGLAGGQVTVAPNPSLPSPVVATAWTYKLSCQAVDVATLQRFINDRAGKGFGQGSH